jgi:actin-like ATPase involved in cell morphogenesis
MMYALGIDLGTTYTAAATWRDGRVEIASLGSRGAEIPSVVLLREDETFLTGETANRRAMTEPGRVAREFKRRLGDPTPLLLGGVPYAAEGLMARLLRWVVDEVSAREGAEPESICVSHPANWGPYKLDLLQQAVRRANLEEPVSFTTEPSAAATFYAQGRPVPSGALVAVYDLGGGTFDAAVLRKTDAGFEILGQPEGIERLGGIDFDAAVFSHVSRAIGDKLDELDEGDPASVAAVARLREECVDAKEALSSDTDVSIPVLLPNLSTEVRLTRAEFEAMVRPVLHESIEALRRALRSAGVAPEDLHAVLLVGGSSRMPIVSQLVGAELGRPVAVDAHPKHAIALGAAWVASGVAPAAVEETTTNAPVVDTDQLSATQAMEPEGPGSAAAAAAGGALAGGAAAAGAAFAAGSAGGSPDAVSSVRAGGSAPTDAGRSAPTDAGRSAPDHAAGVPPEPVSAGAGPHHGRPAHDAGSRSDDRTMIRSPLAGLVSEDGTVRHDDRRGDSGPSGGRGGPDSRNLLLVVGGLVVVAAIALAAWWFGIRDDGTENVSNEQPGDGEQQEQGEEQGEQGEEQGEQGEEQGEQGEENPLPADEQCSEEVMSNERWVCITSAAVVDGNLVIEYDQDFAGDTPNINGGFHVHFYGADETGTNPPDSIMGTHAADPGVWYIEDQEPSVHALDSSQAQDIGDAPKVCSRIANGAHELVPDAAGGFNTGNCWPITRG